MELPLAGAAACGAARAGAAAGGTGARSACAELLGGRAALARAGPGPLRGDRLVPAGAAAPVATEHCPDPCPACPKPEKGGFKWGIELGIGFITLLIWEAVTTCGAALRSQVRRLFSGSRAAGPPATPAALEDSSPAGKPDRRFPRGTGRLVAA